MNYCVSWNFYVNKVFQDYSFLWSFILWFLTWVHFYKVSPNTMYPSHEVHLKFGLELILANWIVKKDFFAFFLQIKELSVLKIQYTPASICWDTYSWLYYNMPNLHSNSTNLPVGLIPLISLCLSIFLKYSSSLNSMFSFPKYQICCSLLQ